MNIRKVALKRSAIELLLMVVLVAASVDAVIGTCLMIGRARASPAQPEATTLPDETIVAK